MAIDAAEQQFLDLPVGLGHFVREGSDGTVGTANIDNRSFRLNFEVIAAIYDRNTNRELAEHFLVDESHATALDPNGVEHPGVTVTIPARNVSFISRRP